MRVVEKAPLIFGNVDISAVTFRKSRDDIPQLLKGLQYIYVTPSLRKAIFTLLETEIAPEISKKTGRPGMELWKVFVLGVMRLALNCDYDRLESLANYHAQIRQMLGHNFGENVVHYPIQTLKDNISLFTPALLDKINQIVVNGGHVLVKKKEIALHGRCDSFVLETNVHYPTDINLLFDAIRKTIELIAPLCNRYGYTDYRQSVYLVRAVKRLMRKAQNKKRHHPKIEAKQKKQEQELKKAHQDYIQFADQQVQKAVSVINRLEEQELHSATDIILIDNVKRFIVHAERQINQIDRRVLQGKVIPHGEKVFSLFQPHTEWICKGKPGVPVELGIRVCILEDQHQFILHHHIMEKQTDDKVAVLMTDETKKRFLYLSTVSFDKGFHSHENQLILAEKLDLVALSRKGKLSKKSQAIESAELFKKAKRKHSAVESAINALEVHGLDVCPDVGITNFKRYVSFAIVSRNIQRIGAVLQKQELAREKRKRKNTSVNDILYKIAV